MMVRSAVAVVAQTLITVVTLFVLYGFLLKTLGPQLLGLWSLVLGATSVSRIAELGLAGGVVKFVAKHYARNDPDKAAAIIETAAISIAVLIGVLSPVAYFVLGRVLHAIVPGDLYSQALHVLPMSLCSLWLVSVCGVFQSGLDARQRFDLRVIAACISQLLFFVLALVLVRRYGFDGLAYSQVIQSLVVLALSWLLLRGQMRSLPLVPMHWDLPVFREMFGYAAAFQANGLAQLLFEPTTKILLSKFGGVASVAYYEMANRMVVQLRSLLVSASQVIVPAVAGLVEKEPAAVPRMYAKCTDLMVFLAVIGFAALALATPAVSQLWIGHYEPTFVFFSYILIFSWWANSLNVPAYQMYLGIGRLRWNSASHLIMGVLNAVLGAGLGWAFGKYGVLAGMGIALVFGSIILSAAFHREFHLQWSGVVSPGTRSLYAMCIALVVAAPAMFAAGRSGLALLFLTACALLLFGILVALLTRHHPVRALLWQKFVLLTRRAAHT